MKMAKSPARRKIQFLMAYAFCIEAAPLMLFAYITGRLQDDDGMQQKMVRDKMV